MQKNYHLNFQHYLHFTRIFYKKIEKSSYVFLGMKALIFISYAILGLLIIFITSVDTLIAFREDNYAFGMEFKYWVFTSLIFISIIFFLTPIIYRDVYNKIMRNDDGLILGNWHFSADEKSIDFTKLGVKAIYDWSKFNQIYIDDFIVVLWSGPGEGVIIPTNTFLNKSEFDEFVKLSQISPVDYKIQSLSA